MTIELQTIDGHLFALHEDVRGTLRLKDLTCLQALGVDLERFLRPILARIRSYKDPTVKNELNTLASFGRTLEKLEIKRLPHSEEDWQQFILAMHCSVLTSEDSNASVEVRVRNTWYAWRNIFLDLINDGIAPVSVHLPPARIGKHLSLEENSSFQPQYIGEHSPESGSEPDANDRLLASISLSRTDAQYIDDVRDLLAFRRNLLFGTLKDYWNILKTNIDFGINLANSADKNLIERIRKGQLSKRELRYCVSPTRGLEALANHIEIIKSFTEIGVEKGLDKLPSLTDEIRKLLPIGSVSYDLKDRLSYLEIPPNLLHRKGFHNVHVVSWWLGQITHIDTSLIVALLIMLQPSWTPYSLLYAKVTDRNGKQYLDFPDDGPAFEINKARAKSMKKEALHPISYEIISTIIKISAPTREALKRVNSKNSSLLFLPYANGKPKSPIFEQANSYLSNAKSRDLVCSSWIGNFYPELVENGMGSGTISFSKIRRTEGILEWFRTKSIRAVSKKLGNTEKVATTHYIPDPLLNAWNTRLVRRFQNILIAVATAGEEYCFEATDFETLTDFHSFLIETLQLHPPGNSPLAFKLHAEYRNLLDPDDSSPILETAKLYITISKQSLSALYCYQHRVINSGLTEDALRRCDPNTGLSPRHFLLLADMLQTNLPCEKDPALRECHYAALESVDNLDSQVQWDIG